MSISFYVEDWEKQPTEEKKVLASTIFETMEQSTLDCLCEYDPFFKKDEDGNWYEMKTVEIDPFPTTTIVHGNITLFLNLIGFEYMSNGSIKKEQLSSVIKTVQRSLNSSRLLENNCRETTINKNMVSCGIDKEAIENKLKEILEILVFAKKENKSVYWG